MYGVVAVDVGDRCEVGPFDAHGSADHRIAVGIKHGAFYDFFVLYGFRRYLFGCQYYLFPVLDDV